MPLFTGYNPFAPVLLPTSQRFLRFLDRRADAEAAAEIPVRSPEVIRALAADFEANGWRDVGGEG